MAEGSSAYWSATYFYRSKACLGFGIFFDRIFCNGFSDRELTYWNIGLHWRDRASYTICQTPKKGMAMCKNTSVAQYINTPQYKYYNHKQRNVAGIIDEMVNIIVYIEGPQPHAANGIDYVRLEYRNGPIYKQSKNIYNNTIY